MSLIDQLDEGQQTVFRSASTEVELDHGAYLLRRGEAGGDMYLVVDGTLDIVDRRATPEVVITSIRAGDTVGEMSFLDSSPRSADVRANGPVKLLRWNRDDLTQLLDREPALAARFFEALARQAGARVRAVTTDAVSGAISSKPSSSRVGLDRTRERVTAITDAAKTGLLDAETRLRQDPNDEGGISLVHETLDTLQEAIASLFDDTPEVAVQDEASRVLSRELHPYFVRSALAERCIRRSQGASGAAEVLAHVLVDTASGDGQLGELIDRWLLDRPSLVALRSGRPKIVGIVSAALPVHRNRRVLLINAGTGSLVAALNPLLGAAPTVLSVIDQSRDALAFLDAGVAIRPQQVELQTYQENLVALSLGRSRQRLPPQDVIVVHGLLEYMPDRIALSLLRVAREQLVQEGTLVATALGPAADQQLLDRLLSWPTVRRRRERLHRLLGRAGLRLMVDAEVRDPLVLVSARPA